MTPRADSMYRCLSPLVTSRCSGKTAMIPLLAIIDLFASLLPVLRVRREPYDWWAEAYETLWTRVTELWMCKPQIAGTHTQLQRRIPQEARPKSRGSEEKKKCGEMLPKRSVGISRRMSKLLRDNLLGFGLRRLGHRRWKCK